MSAFAPGQAGVSRVGDQIEPKPGMSCVQLGQNRNDQPIDQYRYRRQPHQARDLAIGAADPELECANVLLDP